MFDIRPYQQKAISAAQKAIMEAQDPFEENHPASGMILLPTGCGKTFAAWQIMQWMVEEFNARILFLAHRDELIDQTIAEGKPLYPHLIIGKEKAGEIAGPECDVVVASQQSIGSEIGLQKRLKGQEFELIVIDEAHHATKLNTYGKICGRWRDAHLIGLTATPKRLDRQALHSHKDSLFRTVFYRYTIAQAWKDKYLCPIREKQIALPVNIAGVKSKRDEFGDTDFVESDLIKNLKDRPDAISAIVSGYLQHGEGRRCAFFTWDVQSAKDLAAALNAAGVRSEAVWGDNTPAGMERRKNILRSFSGDNGIEGTGLFGNEFKGLQAITNMMVLTEGWNDKSLSCIAMCRPTKSWGLFVQVVGRGLRIATGKTDCLLLTYCAENDGHDAMRLPAIADLPPKTNLEDRTLGEVLEIIEGSGIGNIADFQKPDAAPLTLSEILTIGRVKREFQLSKTPDEIAPYTKLKWVDVSSLYPDRVERTYHLNNASNKSAATLEENSDTGLYQLRVNSPKGDATFDLKTDSLESAFKGADNHIRNMDEFRGAINLLDRTMGWNSKPVTPAQRWLLESLMKKAKIPAEMIQLVKTSGDASSAIDYLKRNQKGTT